MTNGKTETPRAVNTMIPAVDIVENTNSYVVKLDIPGAEKSKIKAHIENNTLTVSAPVERYFTDEKENETIREYRREFSLANDVDLNTVQAQYERGILTVTLNKKQQFLSKQITIN